MIKFLNDRNKSDFFRMIYFESRIMFLIVITMSKIISDN